jgi:hypothetical protein
MNKLAERLRAARRRDRRLGFAAAAAGAASRGLLIAARGAEPAGADLALLPDGTAIAAGDALAGVELSPLTAEGAEAAEAAGAAFVVYDPDQAEAEALLRVKLDYVLRLPARDIEDGELRAVASLRPTLVIGPAVAGPMPVAALIALRRIGLGVGAPLAVTVPAAAGADLLEVLRDSGVVVLVLESPSADEVAALRARVAELPVRSRRREDDAPVVTGVRPEGSEDDFDDD